MFVNQYLVSLLEFCYALKTNGINLGAVSLAEPTPLMMPVPPTEPDRHLKAHTTIVPAGQSMSTL